MSCSLVNSIRCRVERSQFAVIVACRWRNPETSRSFGIIYSGRQTMRSKVVHMLRFYSFHFHKTKTTVTLWALLSQLKAQNVNVIPARNCKRQVVKCEMKQCFCSAFFFIALKNIARMVWTLDQVGIANTSRLTPITPKKNGKQKCARARQWATIS
jgi:hypothetical protein